MISSPNSHYSKCPYSVEIVKQYYESYAKMINWCYKVIGAGHWTYSLNMSDEYDTCILHFYFKNEGDAVMFKLKFGSSDTIST